MGCKKVQLSHCIPVVPVLFVLLRLFLWCFLISVCRIYIYTHSGMCLCVALSLSLSPLSFSPYIVCCHLGSMMVSTHWPS